MTTRTHIADPSNGGIASVVQPLDHEHNAPKGLACYTEPRGHFDTDYRYFINPVYGRDMNINGATSGAGGEVFGDGLDTLGWTGLPALGWNYADLLAANTGAAGISFAGADGVKAFFNKNVGSIDIGLYTNMQLDIFLTSFSLGNQLTVQFRDIAGNKVGNKVDLALFMNTAILGAWQTVSVPLGVAGFGVILGQLVSQVEIRPRLKAGLTVPVFFIDNAQFSKAGAGALGSQVFTMPRDVNKVTKVLRIKISLARAGASTLLNGTMPNLSYNTLLGLAKLPIGISLRITRHGVVAINAVATQLLDLMELPDMKLDSGSDGINTWLTLEWAAIEAITLIDVTDKAEIIINDDLSSFLSCRVIAEVAYEGET